MAITVTRRRKPKDARAFNKWRARMKMTQEQASAALGMSLAAVRSYDQGRRVVPAFIKLLIRYVELHGVLSEE